MNMHMNVRARACVYFDCLHTVCAYITNYAIVCVSGLGEEGGRGCGKELETPLRSKQLQRFYTTARRKVSGRPGEVAAPSFTAFPFQTSLTGGHWRPGGPFSPRDQSFSWLLSAGCCSKHRRREDFQAFLEFGSKEKKRRNSSMSSTG